MMASKRLSRSSTQVNLALFTVRALQGNAISPLEVRVERVRSGMISGRTKRDVKEYFSESSSDMIRLFQWLWVSQGSGRVTTLRGDKEKNYDTKKVNLLFEEES